LAIKVLKFGGTSVATIERMASVAAIVRRETTAGHQLVVVVSAMGNETDRLRDMAYQVARNPAPREMDMLLTAGERISMSLLSMALGHIGIRSRSFTGSQSGILTDGVHTNARIRKILGDRIRHTLTEQNVAIVAGFQGMHLDTKEITTLGRGGSDLTAVALASSLGAEGCEIYTDVRGVCAADPRFVSNSQVIPQLYWSELTELAWMGAGVMHNRAAQMAESHQIRVTIRSSYDPDHPGTLVQGVASVETAHVRAIAHKSNVALLSLRFGHSEHFALSQALNWFWAKGTYPLMAQQSIHPGESQEVRLLVDQDHAQDFLSWLDESGNDETNVRVVTDAIAAITIVGSGFWQNPEIVSQVCEIVREPIELVDVRNNSITICIDEKHLSKVLLSLHAALIAEPTSQP
jgi:aspartate kinase